MVPFESVVWGKGPPPCEAWVLASCVVGWGKGPAPLRLGSGPLAYISGTQSRKESSKYVSQVWLEQASGKTYQGIDQA